MDRACPDCDAPLTDETSDGLEMTRAERLYRCPDCGAVFALDAGNYLRPLDE